MLDRENWRPEVYDELVTIVGKNANEGRFAVFDWDNTTAARCLETATVGQMIAEGKITKETVPQAIMPTFTVDGQTFSWESTSLLEYNAASYNATTHEGDPMGGYSESGWLAQTFTSQTVQDVVAATATVYDNGSAAQDIGTPNASSIAGNPDVLRPFVFPEMADLYGFLLSNGIDVHVVSAGNPWAVRYVVDNFLNPFIKKKYGDRVELPPHHVIGVGLLIHESESGRLYKDHLLVTDDDELGKNFATLDVATLSRFRITSQVDFPLPDFVGKVANVLAHISDEQPLLVAGDSAGDFFNLERSEHKLWMAHLETPGAEQAAVEQMAKHDKDSWLVQTTLFRESPGFVENGSQLATRLEQVPAANRGEILKSVSILSDAGVLGGFGAFTALPSS